MQTDWSLTTFIIQKRIILFLDCNNIILVKFVCLFVNLLQGIKNSLLVFLDTETIVIFTPERPRHRTAF
jgi:hypothetical protein